MTESPNYPSLKCLWHLTVLSPAQRSASAAVGWTRTEIDLNRWVKPLTQKSGPVFLHPDEEEWDTRAELHLTGTRHRQTPPNNVTAPWHMRWQNAAVRVFCRLTAACGHDGVIHTKYSVSARAVNEISRKFSQVSAMPTGAFTIKKLWWVHLMPKIGTLVHIDGSFILAFANKISSSASRHCKGECEISLTALVSTLPPICGGKDGRHGPTVVSLPDGGSAAVASSIYRLEQISNILW